MSICLKRVPISGLGEPNIYQNLGDFTRKWEFYLEGEVFSQDITSH